MSYTVIMIWRHRSVATISKFHATLCVSVYPFISALPLHTRPGLVLLLLLGPASLGRNLTHSLGLMYDARQIVPLHFRNVCTSWLLASLLNFLRQAQYQNPWGADVDMTNQITVWSTVYIIYFHTTSRECTQVIKMKYAVNQHLAMLMLWNWMEAFVIGLAVSTHECRETFLKQLVPWRQSIFAWKAASTLIAISYRQLTPSLVFDQDSR